MAHAMYFIFAPLPHKLKDLVKGRDVLSDTGSIDETNLQRCQKAVGISTQITSMLSSLYIGSFHFEIAMVLAAQCAAKKHKKSRKNGLGPPQEDFQCPF